MDDREQVTEPEEHGYEPPTAEELDTDGNPAVTAPQAQTLLPG